MRTEWYWGERGEDGTNQYWGLLIYAFGKRAFIGVVRD